MEYRRKEVELGLRKKAVGTLRKNGVDFFQKVNAKFSSQEMLCRAALHAEETGYGTGGDRETIQHEYSFLLSLRRHSRRAKGSGC